MTDIVKKPAEAVKKPNKPARSTALTASLSPDGDLRKKQWTASAGDALLMDVKTWHAPCAEAVERDCLVLYCQAFNKKPMGRVADTAARLDHGGRERVAENGAVLDDLQFTREAEELECRGTRGSEMECRGTRGSGYLPCISRRNGRHRAGARPPQPVVDWLD